MDIGIARVIGDMLAFQSGPGRAGDDFAWLCLNITKANLLVFFVERQMRMFATSHRAERFPCFHGDLTVGFRGQSEDHFRRVQRGFNQRTTFRRAITLGVVELAEEIDLGLGVPRNALAAVTKFVHQGAERGETLVRRGVIALHHDNVRRSFTGD